MPITDFKTETTTGSTALASPSISMPEPEYRAVFVESPNVFQSLFRQIRDGLREPRMTVPPEYYRGEAALHVGDGAWFALTEAG